MLIPYHVHSAVTLGNTEDFIQRTYLDAVASAEISRVSCMVVDRVVEILFVVDPVIIGSALRKMHYKQTHSPLDIQNSSRCQTLFATYRCFVRRVVGLK